MPGTLLLALTLVFPAGWLQSQGASGQTTVEGCLQGSDGHYTLTDQSGRTYELQGDMWKLTAHVGHEVRITTPISGSIATDSGLGSEATATQQPILTVESVKHVSATCQTAATKHE